MMQEEEKEAAWEDHQMCSNKMKQFSATQQSCVWFRECCVKM